MNFRKVLPLFLLALTFVLPAANGQAFLTARHSHTITLLPDGNYLVVGGIDDTGSPLATAEIYITSKAVFEAIPQLTDGIARSSHTATLLGNGKVLVAGGYRLPL